MTLEEFLEEWNSPSPTVLVHTSGSTGRPKRMLVEKRRMEASARVTCGFLGLSQGDTALLCLPLDYIAGKMMVVRALTCGLRLVAAAPSGLPAWQGSVDFAAMVPLQVWNLLHDTAGRQRLQTIRHLIVGGGTIDDALARELSELPHHVWSTYGMTETLSHIALRRLNGPERSEWYTPFAGVGLSVSAEGCLVISAPAVHDGPLVTNDMVELEHSPLTTPLGGSGDGACCRFRVLGRRDNVICSGGVKIQIEEVERLLRPHLSVPYMITRAKDARLGEQVVLLIEQADAGEERRAIDDAEAVCRQALPRYWRPRRILPVCHLPMTPTGKPARAEAEELARKDEWTDSDE